LPKLSQRVKLLIVFLFVLISLLMVYPSLEKYYYDRDSLYKSDKNLENVLARTNVENMTDDELVESARVLTFSRHSKELEPYLLEMEKRPTIVKECLFFKSEDHLNNLRYDDAQVILEESVTQFPNDGVTLTRYAEFMIISNPEKLLKTLKQATAIPEEDVGYYREIVKTVEQFISLKANSELEAYEFLLKSNLNPSAPIRILYLEKLIQNKDTHMNEKYTKYHIELGNLYSMYGYSENALRIYRNVLDQSGSVTSFIGLEYFKNKDMDGISELLKTVVKDSSEEYMLLGIRAYMEGNYQDASEWYEKSLKKDENNLINHYLMVFSYHQMGSKTKAINHNALFKEAYNRGINGELPFPVEYYGDLMDIIGDNLRTDS